MIEAPGRIAFELSKAPDQLAPSAGEWIRDFRRRERLSLLQLADMLGVSRQAVWYWEKGYRRPRPEIVRRLRALAKKPTPDSDGAAGLAAVLESARDRLAAELGIAPDRIHITIIG